MSAVGRRGHREDGPPDVSRPAMLSSDGRSRAVSVSSPSPRARLGRKQRLRKESLFQETYDQNRRVFGKHMVMFLRSAPDSSLRLGVVASRKVGPAVDRARAKRRLREVYRRNRYCFQPAFDVILIARRSLLCAPWAELESELLELAKRSGLLLP